MRVPSGLSTSTIGVTFHPIFMQELRFKADVVPDDPDQQVASTILLMCRYAQEDSTSTEIQAEAQGILQANYGASKKELTCKVWEWVQRKIQFLRDERTGESLEGFLAQTYADAPIVEVLIRPRDMALMENVRVGDCDDYAMYAAALLLALGIPAAYVTVAGDKRNPGRFTHVYVAAYPDGERVVVDASHGPSCGWEATQRLRLGARKKEWMIGASSGSDSGLGSCGVTLLMILAGALILAVCE